MNPYLAYFLGLFTILAVIVAFYAIARTDDSVELFYNKVLCSNIDEKIKAP